jgi:hypothetical protein
MRVARNYLIKNYWFGTTGIQVFFIIGQRTRVRQSLYCWVRIKMRRSIASATLAFISIFANTVIASDEPPVKMSKSGICHERGSTYYSKTKNYTSYNTLDEYLRTGGRKAKG